MRGSALSGATIGGIARIAGALNARQTPNSEAMRKAATPTSGPTASRAARRDDAQQLPR